MENSSILYPAILMIFLTFFLYVKNYLDNRRATSDRTIKFGYFKAYQGDVPEYIAVSRETLKNQFELPIIYYFLTSIILIYDQVSILDIIFTWIFVISRYFHCYVRLTSNYVPTRAKIFQIGLLSLVVLMVNLLYNIL